MEIGLNFTPQESSTLYRLLAETTTDIILKTDCEGFIVHASPGIEGLGFLLPSLLIGPHLLDLIHPSCAETIEAEHAAALAGEGGGQWIEFLAQTKDHQPRWFELLMRGLRNENGQIYGALGIMRNIEERRGYEDKLFVAGMTDPLTGLTNRRAFILMLQHLVDGGAGGCLAIFDIDHFKAINMQHGQSAGDEVLVKFSELLRASMRSQDIISRISGESIGVLLPNARPDQAEAICQRIITGLAAGRGNAFPERLGITASAGVARIGGSLDDTIRRAELALFLAKARGRNRLEMEDEAPPG